MPPFTKPFRRIITNSWRVNRIMTPSIFSFRYQKRNHIQPAFNQTKHKHLADKCEEVTRWGVYSNISLTLLKGSAGIMTNSIALIADATHSFTDLISDFITYFTIKYSQHKATKNFPFGFGKIDTLGTLSVASILTFGSLYIIKESVDKLYLGSDVLPIIMPQLALGTALFSIILKEWLYRITIKAGSEYSSNVTVANAWHHRSDVYTSIIAFFGITGSMIGYTILDPLCGLIVGFYLFKIGMNFGQIGLYELLDHSCDKHYDKINNLIRNVDGVKTLNDLIITKSGQYINIHVLIVVDSMLNMYQVDNIVGNVKHELHYDEVLNIQNVVVIPISDTLSNLNRNKRHKLTENELSQKYHDIVMR